jgi:hypothetical protein
MAIDRAKGLKMGGSSFNRQEFIGRVVAKLTVNEDLDWMSMYGVVGKHFLRAPAVEFMLGPLAVEAKVMKERKVSKRDEVVRTVRKPQEVCGRSFNAVSCKKRISRNRRMRRRVMFKRSTYVCTNWDA